MMEKYDMSNDDQQLVLSKDVLYDLRPIVISSYVFPIPGTGLKPIAKWMGYQWKHADVGAMSSKILISNMHMIQKRTKNYSIECRD